MIQLLPHQQKALDETKNFNRVAYYLDMGLGKTFVGSEKLKELNSKVNMVICQKSKVDDWIEHFKTYYSNIAICNLTEKKGFESFFSYVSHGYPVIGVINYELTFRRKELLNLSNFTLMLDESSQIQNETAKRSKFILKMQPKMVIDATKGKKTKTVIFLSNGMLVLSAIETDTLAKRFKEEQS